MQIKMFGNRVALAILTGLMSFSFFQAVAEPGKKEKEVLSFKKLSIEEKISHPDLSFCLTFDNKSVVADLSKGDPVSTTAENVDLNLRGTLGYDGASAYRSEKGEIVRYNTLNNISPEKGSMSFWIKAVDYSPKDVSRTNEGNTHKGYAYIRFEENEDKWVHFFVYQYWETPIVYFFWNNSSASKGNYRLCPIDVGEIGQGEWFQVTVTWDNDVMKTYLNGKFESQIQLPSSYKSTQHLVQDPEKSYIGIRTAHFGPKEKDTITLIDDFKVYDKAIPDLSVKNEYLKLIKSKTKIILENIDITLQGVDDNKSKTLDKMDVHLDFSPLSSKWHEEINAGKVKAKYALLAPDGKEMKGKWRLDALTADRIIKGVDQEGDYVFTIEVKSPDGSVEKASKTIYRPDTSWYGNQLAMEDEVPTPWTPISIDSKNTVTLWNREYHFGNSPLPEKIIHSGDSILAAPPRLYIETDQGVADLKYTITKKIVKNASITLVGEGKATDFSIRFKTKIEFDGYIRFDYEILGQPLIKRMKMLWTVKPEYSTFLLTPTLTKNETGKFAFAFPDESWSSKRELWLTSLLKGFCWAPDDDANWIYEPEEKIFTVDIDENGGHCEVNMITKETQMPKAVPYHAMFIATPTRPFPKDHRTFRFYGSQGVGLTSTGGEGMDSIYTFRPDEKFGEWVDKKGYTPGSIGIYGAACALNYTAPEGNYFSKYWLLPGAYNYTFFDKWKKRPYRCLNCCPETGYSDFILYNQKKLFDHPKGNRVKVIYYDLANVKRCDNKLHGCTFNDKFGKEVRRFMLTGLREHLKRTTILSHQHDRVTIYHAQNQFNPMVNAFGDFWFAGEQFRSLISTKKSPYIYCDDIADDIYRTEFNKNVLGSTLVFLPQLLWGKYKDPEVTEAMLTKLLLNDIITSEAYCNMAVVDKVRDVYDKYQLDDATVHLYYQQKEVVASSSDVKLTYFECPDNRYMIVAGNISTNNQDVTIDLTPLKAGLTSVAEEYGDQKIAVNGGKIELHIPARGFKLICFPPKELYPIKDGFDKTQSLWDVWKPKTSKGVGDYDSKTGRTDSGSMTITLPSGHPEDKVTLFFKRFPVVAGETYRADVWAKTKGISSDTVVSLSFQMQNEKKSFVGLPVISTSVEDLSEGDWKNIKTEAFIKTGGKWDGVKYIFCTMSIKHTPGGKIWFDDFSLEKEAGNVVKPQAAIAAVAKIPIRFPCVSGFDSEKEHWRIWKNKLSVVDRIDLEEGHDKKGALSVLLEGDNNKIGSFSLMKQVSIEPGKTYRAEVWCKTKDVEKDAVISIAYQFKDEKLKYIGLPIQTIQLPSIQNGSWQKLVLEFEVPKNGAWARAKTLLCLMGMKNTKAGQVWFDDFVLNEINGNEAVSSEVKSN